MKVFQSLSLATLWCVYFMILTVTTLFRNVTTVYPYFQHYDNVPNLDCGRLLLWWSSLWPQCAMVHVNTVYSYCQLNMSVSNPYSGLPVIHGFVIITVTTLRYDVNAVFSYYCQYNINVSNPSLFWLCIAVTTVWYNMNTVHSYS